MNRSAAANRERIAAQQGVGAHVSSKAPGEITNAPTDVLPTTFSFKLNRGMKGAYGFEMEVHHAKTPQDAVYLMRDMHRMALDNLPELNRME